MNAMWIHSYIVDDKTYCIYQAPSKEAILKHTECAGMPPPTSIEQVTAMLDSAGVHT